MIEWRFPSNDFGEQKGINDSGVSEFRGTPLKSLAREICQNSLDACLKNKKAVVEFNVFKLNTEKIPGKEALKDVFERCYEYWKPQKAQTTKEFYSKAIEEINKDKIDVLRISDFNTTGLKGSREQFNTDWINLTKSSGSSDKMGVSGGSFGIGKFAPFACSYFSTVFYSTHDINCEDASQGVARLVTFIRGDGQSTQGTGYYGNEKNTPVYEQLNLDSDFHRDLNQYGTDIYVPGYKYGGENWGIDIIVSVLDSFLGALWNEKLEVKVGNVFLNKNTLNEIIEIYKDDLISTTINYYRTLTSNDTVWHEEDFKGMGEVRLGLLLGDDDSPNRVAMIRKNGMKIMDKDRLNSHVPVTGIMFINGERINEELRLLENPKHTCWEVDRAKNKLKAKELIRSINKYIKDKIEELISSGAGESIDAIGVGNLIPDDCDDLGNNQKENVVTDKVMDVDIKEVKHNAKTNDTKKSLLEKNDEEDEEQLGGHTEPGGDGEDWFHPGGKHPEHNPRPSENAHVEGDGNKPFNTKKQIEIKKFVCICTDMLQGKYVMSIEPNEDCKDGEIELYLSAETKKYNAPIKNVNVFGQAPVKVVDNVIKGLDFKKDVQLRMAIDLDFSEYCSMEVALYENQK